MQPTNINKLSFLALRVLGSLIFITAGFNHLFQTNQAASRLEKAKMGFLATSFASPETLIILSGIGLLTGGFMLLAGFQTRKAAMLLLLILIPITLTMQMGSAATMGPLFKNIAIMGMLLFFIANDAVYYSFDQLTARTKTLAKTSGKVLAIVMGSSLLISACAPATVISNQQTSEVSVRKNYGILISQPDHLKAAVHTAQTMRKETKYNAGEIVVMACAKSVEAFQKNSEMPALIEAGKTAGISFKVCGMSLEKFKIAPENITENATIIPNGLTYMFDLKQQGFITVEL